MVTTTNRFVLAKYERKIELNPGALGMTIDAQVCNGSYDDVNKRK